jgi:hypothetical protein
VRPTNDLVVAYRSGSMTKTTKTQRNETQNQGFQISFMFGLPEHGKNPRICDPACHQRKSTASRRTLGVKWTKKHLDKSESTWRLEAIQGGMFQERNAQQQLFSKTKVHIRTVTSLVQKHAAKVSHYIGHFDALVKYACWCGKMLLLCFSLFVQFLQCGGRVPPPWSSSFVFS